MNAFVTKSYEKEEKRCWKKLRVPIQIWIICWKFICLFVFQLLLFSPFFCCIYYFSTATDDELQSLFHCFMQTHCHTVIVSYSVTVCPISFVINIIMYYPPPFSCFLLLLFSLLLPVCLFCWLLVFQFISFLTTAVIFVLSSFVPLFRMIHGFLCGDNKVFPAMVHDNICWAILRSKKI